MSIPIVVQDKLHEALWKRGSESNASAALKELGIDSSSEFAEFFRQYWGPFHSSRVGHELLDIVEQEESIITATEAAREEFGFPGRYIVVSTLMGMSVLVYDKDSQGVFDVDFEGGEELLLSGKLEARWQSWNDFVSDYFGQ